MNTRRHQFLISADINGIKSGWIRTWNQKNDSSSDIVELKATELKEELKAYAEYAEYLGYRHIGDNERKRVTTVKYFSVDRVPMFELRAQIGFHAALEGVDSKQALEFAKINGAKKVGSNYGKYGVQNSMYFWKAYAF